VAGELNPTTVDLDAFLGSMTSALISASEGVAAATTASGHRYVVPEISVAIAMSFTYESGKVKGWIRKSTETHSQQLDSQVTFRIVTVPPRADSAGVGPLPERVVTDVVTRVDPQV
jgi:hypothetical protein